MKITVIFLDGKMNTIDVDPTSTVAEVKSKISQMPPIYQILIFNNQSLDDEKTLKEYEISKDSIIYYKLRLGHSRLI